MTTRFTRAQARKWLPGMAAACLVAAAPAVAGDGAEQESEAHRAQQEGSESLDEGRDAQRRGQAESDDVATVTEEASDEPDQGRRKPKESWTSGASTSDPSPGDAGAPDGED